MSLKRWVSETRGFRLGMHFFINLFSFKPHKKDEKKNYCFVWISHDFLRYFLIKLDFARRLWKTMTSKWTSNQPTVLTVSLFELKCALEYKVTYANECDVNWWFSRHVYRVLKCEWWENNFSTNIQSPARKNIDVENNNDKETTQAAFRVAF